MDTEERWMAVAEMSDGASDKTIRDVTENCRTLRFESFGFEET